MTPRAALRNPPTPLRNFSFSFSAHSGILRPAYLREHGWYLVPKEARWLELCSSFSVSRYIRYGSLTPRFISLFRSLVLRYLQTETNVAAAGLSGGKHQICMGISCSNPGSQLLRLLLRWGSALFFIDIINHGRIKHSKSSVMGQGTFVPSVDSTSMQSTIN